MDHFKCSSFFVVLNCCIYEKGRDIIPSNFLGWNFETSPPLVLFDLTSPVMTAAVSKQVIISCSLLFGLLLSQACIYEMMAPLLLHNHHSHFFYWNAYLRCVFLSVTNIQTHAPITAASSFLDWFDSCRNIMPAVLSSVKNVTRAWTDSALLVATTINNLVCAHVSKVLKVHCLLTVARSQINLKGLTSITLDIESIKGLSQMEVNSIIFS